MYKNGYLFALILVLFVSGCVTTGSVTQTKQTTIKPPPIYSLDRDEVPADVKLVAATITDRLRGVQQTKPRISFDPAGIHNLGEQGFDFFNFVLNGLALTAYTAADIGSGRIAAKVEGILTFRDIIDRAASVFFAAEYTLSAQGLVIHKSATANIPSPAPSLETYFVPAKHLKAAKDSLKTFPDYYLFALDNAVPMTLSGSKGESAPKTDYVIMTFCMDRLQPFSQLEMKVSNNKSLVGVEVVSPSYIIDEGWWIMIAGGKFEPGSSSNIFYVGVKYKVDARKNDPALLLATFANRRTDPAAADPIPKAKAPKQADYTSPSVAKQAAPVISSKPASNAQPYGTSSQPASPPAQRYDTPEEGPLALGTTFLDLKKSEDIGIIQRRLKELGLYAGTFDGKLNSKTKEALDKFADQNGFARGYWTLDMQKKFFKGSGS